jgi:hypothetical protein
MVRETVLLATFDAIFSTALTCFKDLGARTGLGRFGFSDTFAVPTTFALFDLDLRTGFGSATAFPKVVTLFALGLRTGFGFPEVFEFGIYNSLIYYMPNMLFYLTRKLKMGYPMSE